ncbi:MAG: MCE family protein, partial [Acidimicrobiales bacterium]
MHGLGAGAMRRARMLVATLLVGALGLGGCGLVGGGGGTYGITAYFPRAVALYEQGQVRVLGLPAGRITEVATDGNRVRVKLAIDDDVPLPADVQAIIVPQSLIGERYVQLLPAWIEGEPRAEDGHEIDVDDTIIPVEPDEALAALNTFINSLDPDGLGRLIGNLATDLEGNGKPLNRALDNLGDLVDTFAQKDDQLVSIVESFDRFTQTLTTREQQLGVVLDAFGTASQVLADERQSLENLVASLAGLSETGLDLVAEHATELRGNIATLARLGHSINANLDAVAQLLDSGPILTRGLLDAYNPELRAFNLRNNFGALIQPILDTLLGGLGLGFEFPCLSLPLLGRCEPAAAVAPQAGSTAVPVQLPAGTATPGPTGTPIDTVLALLASPP